MNGKRDRFTLIGVVGIAAFALFFIVPATAADTGTADTTIAAGPVIVDEQFSSSTLDPAWTFVQRSGRGRYSLTDNPGAFRYYGEGSCTGQALSWWDPAWSHNWPQGSYLLRTFAGDCWVLRAAVKYDLHGISNGNSMGAQDPHLAIVFGEGTGPKVDIQRVVDYWYRRDVLNIHLQNAEGGDPMLFPDYVSPNTPIDFREPEDVYHYTGSEGWINHTYWYEVVRDGREVTIGISTDGATYTPARSFTLPSTTAATQRIAFYLSEWAQVGSFIDVDKVTVQALADPNLATVPGTIQAEDYDVGGEGVAYHDTTPGNSGGVYRQDDVDIEVSGGATCVGWVRNGEYLTYTVNVATARTYTMTARVASPNSGRTVALSVDGTQAATIAVPNTGYFSTFGTVSVPVALTAGGHTLRLTFSGDGQNLDWVEFSAATMPPPTPTPTPAVTATLTVTTPRPTPTPLPESVVPGRIEAEHFDAGGEGVAYHDTTIGNSGGAGCRTAEDVDIASLPEDGYAVVGIEDGEWLSYTIDRVANTGDNSYPYPVELFLASDRDGRTVQVEVDGNIVRNVSVPNTGSLQNFAPVLTQCRLTPWGQPEQGRHTIRLLFHGDGQAIDKVIIWENRPRGWADGWAWPGFTANQTRGQAPLTVQFTDRTSPYTYGWRWFFNDGAYSSVQNPVHTYLNPGVYTVSLQVQEEDHWSGSNGMFMWFHHLWESKTATMQVTVERPVIAVQSGSATPIDGDGDGLHEDLNGNGRKDFEDVVLFFNQLDWIAANEPMSAFDCNGNGRIDFADAVRLFNNL